MIFLVLQLIMDALKALIIFVIGLFPPLPDLSFLNTYIDSFVSVIKSLNQFVSVPTIGICFLAIFACYHARAIWSIIMWVVRKIPGVS